MKGFIITQFFFYIMTGSHKNNLSMFLIFYSTNIEHILLLVTILANSIIPLNKRDKHPCPLGPDILVGKRNDRRNKE